MRRKLPWLLLLPTLLLLILWPLSYWRRSNLELTNLTVSTDPYDYYKQFGDRKSTQKSWLVGSERGSIILQYTKTVDSINFTFSAQPGWAFAWHQRKPPISFLVVDDPPFFNFLGFRAGRNIMGLFTRSSEVSTYVSMPCWLLIILLLPLNFFCLRTLRRRRLRAHRLRHNLCLVCGYDLRSSPVRCPECGTTSVQSNTTLNTGAITR